MSVFAEGVCFRATPVNFENGVLTLRTLDQEAVKQEMEERLASICDLPDFKVPPQQKPPFVAGDLWIQDDTDSWERVVLTDDQPTDPTRANCWMVDWNLRAKLNRASTCFRVPDNLVDSVSPATIAPIFHTALVDPSFALDEQLIGGATLLDLASSGTEIMCLVRRIDPVRNLPVIVWYPSTVTPWFERSIALNPFVLPTVSEGVAVKGEVAEVVVVWMTAEKGADADYSVVLGRYDEADRSTSAFYKFRERQMELQRLASDTAIFNWDEGLPVVGSSLFYLCEGVRTSLSTMGPEWVRAVIHSVDFDDDRNSWKIIVSLPDMGNRKMVVAGRNLTTGLRHCSKQVSKFDREPSMPVIMGRLKGFRTADDFRFNKDGFACLKKMKNIVVFFSDTRVDGLGNVIHYTLMLGQDWMRGPGPFTSVGPLLVRADILSQDDSTDVVPSFAVMKEVRLQFPIATDAVLGWPQNKLLSNRVHKVQVVRFGGSKDIVVQLLNDDTRRMLRMLGMVYKISAAPKIDPKVLTEQQFPCVVQLNLHLFSTYCDGIFPLCAEKDGTIFARALVVRYTTKTRPGEVQFYAVDLDLEGWVSMDAVFYLYDLPALHIACAAVQCQMGVAKNFRRADNFKRVLMSEELLAAFGPPTKAPRSELRHVWFLREGLILNDLFISERPDPAVAAPPFSLQLMEEELTDTSTPNRSGRFVYEIEMPIFDSVDEMYRFQVKSTNNPADPSALQLENAVDKTATSSQRITNNSQILLGSIARQLVRALPTKSGAKLLDLVSDEVPISIIRPLPIRPDMVGLLRLLPKLVVESRIEGLDPNARTMLLKLPLNCSRLEDHLRMSAFIAPVSSTVGPDGPIYSSRLYLRLRDGKRYDVAAMLNAWQNAEKWDEQQRCQLCTESRLRRLRDNVGNSFMQAEWPTAIGQRTLCEAPLGDPHLVNIMPADFRPWLDAIARRCQQILDSGRAECIPCNQFSLGLACLAPYYDKLYRAEVVQIANPTVSVFFVDFGNTKEVRMSEIVKVTPDLLAIPKLLFLVQELDYAPINRRSDNWPTEESDAYIEMLKLNVMVELKTGPLLGGFFDVVLYTAALDDDTVSVRLMDRLRFLNGCCEKVDPITRRMRMMLLPPVDFKERRPCTFNRHSAKYCQLVSAVSPHQLYLVGKDEERCWRWACDVEHWLTRVARDRIWPGRLLAAPYRRQYCRVVILAVNENEAVVDAGLIEYGCRMTVPLDSLVELAPAQRPCFLTRMTLVDNSIEIDFDAAVAIKIQELTNQRTVQVILRRKMDIDGVAMFGGDLQIDGELCWTAVRNALPQIPTEICGVVEYDRISRYLL